MPGLERREEVGDLLAIPPEPGQSGLVVLEEALQRLRVTATEAWEREPSLRHLGRAVAAPTTSGVHALAAGHAGREPGHALGEHWLHGTDSGRDDRACAERGEVGRDGGRGGPGILEAVMTSHRLGGGLQQGHHPAVGRWQGPKLGEASGPAPGGRGVEMAGGAGHRIGRIGGRRPPALALRGERKPLAPVARDAEDRG